LNESGSGPHNDGKRALHFDETTRSRGRDAATVDSILKIPARLLEQGRGSRLARRKLNSGDYSGMIHPVIYDRQSAVVDYPVWAARSFCPESKCGGTSIKYPFLHAHLVPSILAGSPRRAA
jgi:hypothetical protein